MLSVIKCKVKPKAEYPLPNKEGLAQGFNPRLHNDSL
jgi:hypothetical protein